MIDRRSLSQERRKAICDRQNGKCADCGDPLKPSMYDIDHRQALIHGGDNADDNLAAICFGCHKDKTRRDVQARSHCDRIAVGGKQRSASRPMWGTHASGWKKPFGSFGGHWR